MATIKFHLPVILVLTTLLLLAAGCRQEELPTRIATAVVPTLPPPTATPIALPPTPDLRSLPTATLEPTTIPPTRPPTATPAPPPASVRITSPAEGAQFVIGSDVIISGLAHIDPDQELQLFLVSANGHLLAETTALRDEVNAWQANLRVPEAVSGPAQLLAAIIAENDDEESEGTAVIVAQDAVGVQLVLDSNNSDRYLALYRPAGGETAVAGYNLFFDGRAQRPVDNVVTISIWHDDCRVRAARQSFVLGGSGYWQGFVVVPQDLEGPACAVAHFGAPGEIGWREAHVPITILPASETQTRLITIGNPPPEAPVRAGEPLLIYGTAANARNQDLLVTIILDNGRILTEGVATADYWGYWELSVYLMPDTEGLAHIYASLGPPGGAGHTQTQSTILIRPGD